MAANSVLLMVVVALALLAFAVLVAGVVFKTHAPRCREIVHDQTVEDALVVLREDLPPHPRR